MDKLFKCKALHFIMQQWDLVNSGSFQDSQLDHLDVFCESQFGISVVM
jgi:hypothetical protein